MTDNLSLEEILKLGKKVDFWTMSRGVSNGYEGYYKGVKISVWYCSWEDDRWYSHLDAVMEGTELGYYSFGKMGNPKEMEPGQQSGTPEIKEFFEYVKKKPQKEETYWNRRKILLKRARRLAK